MTRSSPSPLVSVRNLVHEYPGGGPFSRNRGAPIQALKGVSFQLEQGECLAIVGESGSGKTTLARSLVRLVEPTGGEVLYRGVDVLSMGRLELQAFRRKAQVVFQDPSGSLNPRLRAGSVLEEVLKFHGSYPDREALKTRIGELFKIVGLNPNHAGRFPHELSGGQRQRLAIARALSVHPEFLVLDEPVSALDLSIQAQILSLLEELRKHLDLSLVLVTHDLGVVRQVSDRVAVLYEGRLMEVSPVETLFTQPAHPYTRGLLAATGPGIYGPNTWADWTLSSGEGRGASGSLKGCPLHPRCSHPGKDHECLEQVPELKCLSQGRQVACWKESLGGNGG
jgi:oligopeptide/dipeptide ABC transporter ATP-binding protein